MNLQVDVQKLRFDSNNLIPAIVQDVNSREILMLGYMNTEAIYRTHETGLVTFFSRSKDRLWTKGETSSNFLTFKTMQVDCDNDTLLVQAIPHGPTCHTGSFSCFNEEQGILFNLINTIAERHTNPDSKSYTSQLFQNGIKRIAQKIGEEGVEVALASVAGDDAEFLNESADLLYHLIVLTRAKNLSFYQILDVLKSRSNK